MIQDAGEDEGKTAETEKGAGTQEEGRGLQEAPIHPSPSKLSASSASNMSQDSPGAPPPAPPSLDEAALASEFAEGLGSTL
eukprot:1632703-Amphidinium_carterae.1